MTRPTMRLCDKCRVNLAGTFWFDQVEDEPKENRCNACGNIRATLLYEYENKAARFRRQRREREMAGPPKRDTRARYREPFRKKEE